MKTTQYKYADTSINELESILYQEIFDALYEKYGTTPDPLITKRVKEEWLAFKVNETIIDVAILNELVAYLKESNIVYSSRFDCNSNLIFYLLGISKINPLPAHYYCPHCKKVVWKEEYKCGLDLPLPEICCNDHKETSVDGFDIPHQYYRENAYFTIYAPTNIENTITDFFTNHWYTSKTSPTVEEAQHYTGTIKRIEYANISVWCILKPVDKRLAKSTLNIDVDDLILETQHFAAVSTPKFNVELKCFSDVLSYLGIYNSSYKDEFPIITLINNLKYTPQSLIAFREDLFKYFLKHGLDEATARKATENMRKGKKVIDKYITPEMELSPDKWVIALCKEMNYLASKPETLEGLFYKLQYNPYRPPF